MQKVGSETSGAGRRRLGVTGHQELPLAAAKLLQHRLDQFAQVASDFIVVSSLAVGTDSEVATRMLEAGGHLHVVVPSENYEKTFASSAALDKYRSLLARAETVEHLPFPGPTEEAFLEAGYRVVDQCDALLAVWDGEPARGLGGTADIVARARQMGKVVEVLWPTGLQR